MSTRTSSVRLSVLDGFSAPLRAYVNATKNAKEATGDFAKQSEQLTDHYKALYSASEKVGYGLLGIAGAGAVAGLGVGKLAADFEQTQIAFTTMLKSGTAAKQFLGELRDFAAQTPFEFTELTVASKHMLAMGFAAKDILPILTDIGDAASGLGVGADGVDRITHSLGVMQAKGKVTAMEMRELTNNGIPAWRYLADAMHLTTAEVMDLSSQGLLPAGKALEDIRAGMHKDFGGLMAEQAKTAAGQLSNLKDEATAAGVALGTQLLPAAKEGISVVTDLVRGFNALPDGAKQLTASFLVSGTAIAAFGGAALVVVGKIPSMIAGFQALQGAIEAVGIGSLAALAPIAIVTAAVVASGIALIKIYETGKQLVDGYHQIGDALVKHAADMQTTAKTYGEYTAEVYRSVQGTGFYIDAQGNLVNTLGVVAKQNFLLTQSQFEAAKATRDSAKANNELASSLDDVPKKAMTAKEAYDAWRSSLRAGYDERQQELQQGAANYYQRLAGGGIGATATPGRAGGGTFPAGAMLFNESPATRPEVPVVNSDGSGYVLTKQAAQEALGGGGGGGVTNVYQIALNINGPFLGSRADMARLGNELGPVLARQNSRGLSGS